MPVYARGIFDFREMYTSLYQTAGCSVAGVGNDDGAVAHPGGTVALACACSWPRSAKRINSIANDRFRVAARSCDLMPAQLRLPTEQDESVSGG